jgi:hypothetical protein
MYTSAGAQVGGSWVGWGQWSGFPQAADSKGWQNWQQNILNGKSLFFALKKVRIVEPHRRKFNKS